MKTRNTTHARSGARARALLAAFACGLGACAGLSGCAGADVASGAAREGTPAFDVSAWGKPEAPSSAALYSRDGGVVSAPAPGELRASTASGAPLSGGDDSRMRIIELYQQVLDERDALRSEAGDLRALLEKHQALLADLDAQLQLAQRASDAQRAELERSASEARELADRLATAQIRRLELEHQLLELQQSANHGSSGASAAVFTQAPAQQR
jgi:hypothetical protein